MEIKCPICFTEHSLIKLFKCDNFLSSILAPKINLNIKDLNIKSTLQKNQCENCKKILSSSANFKKHIKSGICIEKIFSCNKCNKIFQKKQKLQYHVEHNVCGENSLEILKNLTQPNVVNNISNVSNTANNTQNIGTQININVGSTKNLQEVVELLPFRNVSYKISPKKYLEYASNPEQAIKKFVKDQHFNPDIPERMNILNTNRRDNRVQLFDFDDDFICRWLTRDKSKICELLVDRAVNTLFFAKDNLARAGIKLDSTKEADIKQIIKKIENDEQFKKKYIDLVADLTYDYKDIIKSTLKELDLLEN